MKKKEKTYIAIDLKSFYASVECVERGLDPLLTNLVVADEKRTEKTICLAVSPSLKACGISGRARLYEVISKMREINLKRKIDNNNKAFLGKSYDSVLLKQNKDLEADYIIAPPRMAKYVEYSASIYGIYLKYIAKEDIHVYSIDEAFMDVTDYFAIYKMSAKELAMKMIRDINENFNITATAGIGPNLYLAKVAMDIHAKNIPADENGVRIAELDEMTYRQLLWDHKPLTDFWRVGRGYAKKLESVGIYTMGDVARCSLGKKTDLLNEDLLYKLFGINAELLIDHAWGYEPCTIADIKNYKPSSTGISRGQVLHVPYNTKDARLVIREMADLMALELAEKQILTDKVVLDIGYDISNITERKYAGETKKDQYGRFVPKPSHGTGNIKNKTNSTKILIEATLKLFDKIVEEDLLVRRMNLSMMNLTTSDDEEKKEYEQLSFFTDDGILISGNVNDNEEKILLEKEKKVQKAILDIKKKYGKNAIVKGMNLKKSATAISRNKKIGGHDA